MKAFHLLLILVLLMPLATKANNYCPEELRLKETKPGVIDIKGIRKQYNETIKNYPLATSKLELNDNVKSLKDLNNFITENSKNNNKTLVFVAAQWSILSKLMANGVLKENSVQNKLKHYILTTINATENNNNHEDIYRQFQVVNPPIFLLFNENGELTKKLENKCLEPEEFIKWLSI